MKFSLDTPNGIWYNSNMVEQTTLLFNDIKQHNRDLRWFVRVDQFLPESLREKIYDDMLERFCNTFLESED